MYFVNPSQLLLLGKIISVFLSVSFHTPSLFPAPGSQDSKDGLSASAKGTDDEKPPSMPEETGKSKVASWLTSQGLKKVSAEEMKEE